MSIVIIAMVVMVVVGLRVALPMLVAMLMIETLAGSWIVGEHQRFNGHWHGARWQADLTEIDVIKIPQHHPVDHQDTNRHIQFIFQDVTE